MADLHRNIFIGVAVLILCLQSVAIHAQGTPIYEQAPFDSLTLKPEFGGGTFKLLPIGFRNGLTPSPLPKTGTLVITFADEPDDKYEVEWAAVASITTYYEAVFAELQQQLRRGAFDAAQGYFDDMFRNAPNFPGLQAAYESMLLTEAKQFLRNGDTQNMAARFERLYAENKDHAELRQLWTTQVDSQLAGLMQNENCDRMRTIISHFEERYPGNEVGKKWRAAIDAAAENHVARAKRNYADRQYVEAYDGIENARLVLGDPDALRDVERSLKELCPRIVVAVSQMGNLPASIFPVENQLDRPDEPPAPLTDATIRSRRLVQHAMIEYSGSGIDGGIYTSPIGLFSETETGFEWVLHDDLKWAADGRTMTAFDLAETLDRLFFQRVSANRNVGLTTVNHVAGASGGNIDGDIDSDSNNPVTELRIDRCDDYMIDRLVRSIDVIDGRTVEVRLNREALFPESRLRVPLARSQTLAFPTGDSPDDVPEDQRNWNGPYFLKRFDPRLPERERHFDRAFYLRNVGDPLSTGDKPGVLVEQTLAAESDVLQLLLEGKIDLVEHVSPDMLPAFRRHENRIALGKYAAPRIHFLLPNRNKPATESRTFLRGMLYGLDRDWMLRQLLGGNTLEGDVLSAPMPKRTKADDPFGYAYNEKIVPRPYEPKLAVALSVTAYNQIKNRELKKEQQRLEERRESTGEETPPDHPEATKEESDITAEKRDLLGYLSLVPDELVIACPPNDTARKACLMIQQQWRTIGIPTRIVEYRPNERIGRGTDVDFWYVEMTMLEPCIDLELLFGNNGMAVARSAYVEQAMSRVRMTRDWREAIEALENLHRTIHDETTVLPLWQINTYFAHRRELTGLSAEAFRLYDHIEQWRLNEKD